MDRKVKDEFIKLVIEQVKKMYSEHPLDNPDYGKMINKKHFDRVLGLIEPSKVVFGGKSNADTLKIEPTILEHVTLDDAIMQEEIFGPVMPIISYDTIDEAERIVKSIEKPLAFYLFTSSKENEDRFIKYTSFGGGCINDTIVHLATSEMGFGGVGNSGMGSYHGIKSFNTFSHEKSILKKYTWLDMPMRYQPYKPLYDKLIRMFLH